ncbi:hypothetical protein CRYUN_Cryun27aG0007700 [Craigia yunnanensis]
MRKIYGGRGESRVKQKWIALEEGWIKMKCDGAFDYNSKDAITWIIPEILKGCLLEARAEGSPLLGGCEFKKGDVLGWVD